ncbi:hypothetical protein BH10ACI2_BH10ACI2_02980 [soil metagenome]
MMRGIVSRVSRPYIKYRWPEMKNIVVHNIDGVSELLELHYELHFRIPKTSINQLSARIENQIRNIIFENWDEPTSLVEFQSHLGRDRTQFEIELNEEIDARLEKLSKDCFRFPSTDTEIGGGEIEIRDWQEKGLLRAIGYTCENGGPVESERRSLLSELYLKDIPSNTGVVELESWGERGKSARLKKIVYSLANFTNQERRNWRGDYTQSVAKRRADLKYMKKRHYDNSKHDWINPNCLE